MTVVGESGLPHDAGRRDSLHHRERLRKKITEQLKERIGEEDMVASGPEKKIRVPVKGTKRWQFIFDRGQAQGVGGGDGKASDVLGPRGRSRRGRGRGRGRRRGGHRARRGALRGAARHERRRGTPVLRLQLPRLKAKTGTDIEASQTVYDQIARKGPQLDKKSTLRENLLRNAKRGRVSLGGIGKPDLRYLSYRDVPRPRNRRSSSSRWTYRAR